MVWKPLGDYMARVFTSEKHWRIEAVFYRMFRVDATSEQRWTTYAAGVLGFSFVGIVLLYLLQRLQPLLPLGFDRGVDGNTAPPAMAFNTAVSFVTNTNWQSYVPETVLGHTVQMAGLTVQSRHHRSRRSTAHPPARPSVSGRSCVPSGALSTSRTRTTWRNCAASWNLTPPVPAI
ncbi:hypothetical protein GCM10009609_69640 [Pseudonocardia aurantiaca]